MSESLHHLLMTKTGDTPVAPVTAAAYQLMGEIVCHPDRFPVTPDERDILLRANTIIGNLRTARNLNADKTKWMHSMLSRS